MSRRLGWIGGLTAAALVVVYPLPAGAHGGGGYTQENLVSDQAGVAAMTDPNLVNAWGMSRSATSPIWVSDNGADVSTLYGGAVNGGPVTINSLVVSVPGGAPTGQANNDTTSFALPGTTSISRFIFIGEDGDLSAWAGGGATAATLISHTDGAIYKGLALAHSAFGPLLLAANFGQNRIDVFDGQFKPVTDDRLFHDPFVPASFAPFNVAEFGNEVYVTYAKKGGVDDVAGPGNGFVDVFTNFGAFEKRLVSHGLLNSPWGLAIAPTNFGEFSGDLLVGNFGDGRIHAYDPHSGHFRGTLTDANDRPIAIDGLWGLITGDPNAGGPYAVWFSAGPDDESHGLLGVLRAAG